MASGRLDVFDEDDLRALALTFAKRVAGMTLFAAAVALAIAILGYDPRDPSLNTATTASARNPLGDGGALVADLLIQYFGAAAWLLPLAFAAWGARLALLRPLRWPWLPPLCLPLALMALAAFCAQFSGGNAAFAARIRGGGLVGLLIWDGLEARLGGLGFFWLAVAALLLTAPPALGLRWRSSLSQASRAGAASVRAGRRLGSLAGAVPDWLPGGEEGDGQGLDGERGGWRNRLSWLRACFAAPRDEAMEEDAPAPAQRSLRPAPGTPRPRARGGRPLPGVDDGPAADDEEAEVPPRVRRPGYATVEREPETEPSRPRTLVAREQPRHPAGPLPPPPEAVEGFVLPALDLLGEPDRQPQAGLSDEMLEETSRQLETVLDDFGVRGQITDAKPGPVVTLYELEPAPGTRAARVISLADDIARSLCALSVRVATVPGRNVIGIELPNERRETVFLRDLLQDPTYQGTGARLPLALGKDISGRPITVDLARMPHLLIAGTTGSGKSVAINAMILSLLYHLRPDQLRLIMIDPKVIELGIYEDIPHLLAPVVTEPHKAVVALKWVVRQMDERYRLMSHLSVRDIFAFNKRIARAQAEGERITRRVRTGFEPGTGVPIYEEQPIETRPLPLIVVIVDEVADLMLTAGKEIENAIQRLSQKARAAGIHLVVATQRPSVDVLTGVIKANLPSRISFRVSSKIDSRTILGEPGAEQLLGHGDMLHLMPGDRIARIHGPLVTESEVERVVRHLKAQGQPDYVDDVTSEADEAGVEDGGAAEAGGAAGQSMYDQAVQIVMRDGKASTSYIQRKLTIGYNSAAKLIERMETEGVISTADHVGRRQVLRRGGGAGDAGDDDY